MKTLPFHKDRGPGDAVSAGPGARAAPAADAHYRGGGRGGAGGLARRRALQRPERLEPTVGHRENWNSSG